jgi:hypothetical protein
MSHIADGAVLRIGGDYTQSDGRTTIYGGALEAGGEPLATVRLLAGELYGHGTIDAHLRNAARVTVRRPGLAVSGDFTQVDTPADTALLRVEVAGPAPEHYATLLVGGAATLADRFSIDRCSWHCPRFLLDSEALGIITADAVHGRFDRHEELANIDVGDDGQALPPASHLRGVDVQPHRDRHGAGAEVAQRVDHRHR